MIRQISTKFLDTFTNDEGQDYDSTIKVTRDGDMYHVTFTAEPDHCHVFTAEEFEAIVNFVRGAIKMMEDNQ